MADWIGYVVVLAVGVVVGVLVSRRGRNRDSGQDPGRALRRMYREAPRFFDELRGELDRPGFAGVREFAILQSSQITFVSEDVRFVFYEEDYPNLLSLAVQLETLDFVDDVTPGKMPIYRMREHFVAALRGL